MRTQNNFSRNDLESLRSVLIIRPDRLGDVIMSIPVYESIKRSLPHIRTTVLVKPGPAEVLKGNPFIDQIIYFNPNRPWSFFDELFKGSFDLAIVLNQIFSGTATALALLSKAPWRAGYANRVGKGVFNIPIPLPKIVKPEIQNNLDLLSHMGFLSLKQTPTVYSDNKIQTKIDLILRKMNCCHNLPLILVKPGTRLEKWGWHLDKFRRLCRELIQKKIGEVLMICGPGEEKLLSSIQTNHTCQLKYEIKDNIPILLIDEAQKL